MNNGRWPPGSPELITLHPDYLKTIIEKNVLFNTDRINKANKNSLADRIGRKFGLATTGADILDTPEATMLHEMMHLKFCGLADDSDGKKSYGWANCVRLKNMDNAVFLV
ncbi:hypothetical protein Daus18300_009354 [Diaporthe australafricana]|uniref:SprT-like domain-containing protein n=1 Tax=Diaporthe australafricana TaxID=127596 RepID=A0ABR3WEX4_9PEZI